MRANKAGRWIVGVLLIGPILIIQLVYLVLIINGNETAHRYLLGDNGGLIDWTAAGFAAMVARALALVLLFCGFSGIFFGLGGSAIFGTSRRTVGALVFSVWLGLLLV